MLLELGECHLDRIEVWTVRRQEEQPCAFGAYGLLSGDAFVGGKVVEDDDIALRQRRGELRLDIGLEDAPVDRGVDDERGGEPVTAQAGNEGLKSSNARTAPWLATGAPSDSGRADAPSWWSFRSRR